MKNKVKLIYNNGNVSYTIAYFASKHAAEHWRDFLVYTMQEYKYKQLKIIYLENY